MAYGVSLIVGIVAICAAPCLVAVRFDALLVPEFREQTWNSLMLLPVDPRVILFEKLRAVLRERIAIFVPVCIAAAFAMASHATAVLMTSAIAMIAGVLMIEVSILNQFYSKIGLAQSAIAFGIILAIAALVPLWAFFEPGTSFAITMMTMLFLVAGFYWLIHWKLRTWSEG